MCHFANFVNSRLDSPANAFPFRRKPLPLCRLDTVLYNTKEGITSLIHHVSFGGYEEIGAKNISTELSRSQYAAFLTRLVLDKIMTGYFTAAPLLLSGYQDPLEHY
jgi:hypothetical protein